MKWGDGLTQERYEDALFALLMGELGEEPAQAADDKQAWLQEETEGDATPELDRRCLGMIRKHYRKEQVRQVGKALWRTVSSVAVAACLMMACFVVAYATSETVRVNTKNLLITVFPTHTELRFPGELEEERSPSLSVGWVPPGYTLTKKGSNRHGSYFDYYDAEGNLLSVDCHSTVGLGAEFDTEDAVVEDVTIQGEKGMLINKHDRYQLVWTAKNNARLITVSSYALSREETFAVAEALAYD